MDDETTQIFLSMPERVTGFDVQLFDRLRDACRGRAAAVVEIAGRDSIAAALSACASGSCEVLIPTVVYTGTEYGKRDAVMENARALALNPGIGQNVAVLETVVIGSPAWWNASASRYSSEHFSRYGFNPTCVACHMYLHAARVPLALALGAGSIIAGERLSHDGCMKINQLEPALAAYRDVVEGENLVLSFPLESTAEGAAIDRLVGPGWPESGRQMRCALAGNYRDLAGGIMVREDMLASYLEEFLVPFTKTVLRAFAEGKGPPDYAAVAGEAMAERGRA